MIYLPTIPSRRITEYRTLMQQAAVTPKNFTASGFIQINTLCTIPAQAALTGVKITLLQQFTGVGMSSFTVQIGTVNVPNYYALAFQLHQIATDSTLQLTSPPLIESTVVSDEIVATFSSIGCPINTISAGAVEILLQYRIV